MRRSAGNLLPAAARRFGNTAADLLQQGCIEELGTGVGLRLDSIGKGFNDVGSVKVLHSKLQSGFEAPHSRCMPD